MTQLTHSESRDTGNEDLERRAERIKDVSPEGAPAHPGATSRSINLVLALIVIAMLALALGVAVIFSPIAGVLLGFIAMLFLLLNPVFWASFHRSHEREIVEEQD